MTATKGGAYEQLIEKGANVNARDAQGVTPLIAHMKHPQSHTKIAQYLISKGADVTVQGKETVVFVFFNSI